VKFISDTYYARVLVSSARIGVDDYKTLVAEKLKTAASCMNSWSRSSTNGACLWLELVVAILVFLDRDSLCAGTSEAAHA